MTDKELLELAAKAAGYVSHGYGELCGGSPFLYLQEADFSGMWAPLTDNGDALRLAVKALNWPHGGRAFDNAVSAMYAVGQLPKDPCAATRRAIVMAAAKVGEAM
jgi:hypothetical protein